MLFARITVMRRAAGKGLQGASVMRTAARAAGAVIPGALVRMSGVVGFHVEDDDLMAQEDSLGLQLGVMNLFDLLTLTTRLRQRGDPRPAMGSSPFTTLPKPATALGTRSFSTTSSSARNESTTSGIAAASAGFAAAACAFNCTVLPVLSAALPALGGAASASCDASVLGVSVSTLKAATFFGVVPLGGFAVWQSYKQHRSPAVAALGSLGVASVAAVNAPAWAAPGLAAAMHAGIEATPWLTEPGAGLGAAAIMVAHFVAARRATARRSAKSCCSSK